MPALPFNHSQSDHLLSDHSLTSHRLMALKQCTSLQVVWSEQPSCCKHQ